MFQTPRGLVHLCRLAFGFVTAPVVFTRIKRKLRLEANQAKSFFDDILVATQSWNDHLGSVDQMLTKLGKHGVTVRPTKVDAGFKEIESLGHVVGGDVMKPVKSKFSKLLDLATRRTKKEVRAVIGLPSYYRRYVPETCVRKAFLNHGW